MKNKFVVFLFIFLSSVSFGQEKKKGTTKATIHTSVECQECKDRIEGVLNYTKGVKYAEVDFVSRDLVVKYKPSVISIEEIKQLVSATGYDADDVKANPEAYEKLPACCKAGGMEH